MSNLPDSPHLGGAHLGLASGTEWHKHNSADQWCGHILPYTDDPEHLLWELVPLVLQKSHSLKMSCKLSLAVPCARAAFGALITYCILTMSIWCAAALTAGTIVVVPVMRWALSS
jgi:hypothetical protein